MWLSKTMMVLDYARFMLDILKDVPYVHMSPVTKTGKELVTK